MKAKAFLLVILIMSIISVNVHAVMLKNYPVQVTQIDGTKISIFRSGDEFYNWLHDENGYTIVLDSKLSNFCWAKAENGDLVSTGIAIHLSSPQSLNLTPRQNISVEKYREKRAKWDIKTRSSRYVAPSIGTLNNIVIFIRCHDDPEFEVTYQEADDIFNKTGVNVNSVKQYYWDASYGALTVNSHIFPAPIGGAIVSYQAEYDRSYLTEYDADLNPNGYETEDEGTMLLHKILQAAIESLTDEIEAALTAEQVDQNNDGYIDNIVFIPRGQPEGWNSVLWSHKSSLVYADSLFIHGKQIWDYNLDLEGHVFPTEPGRFGAGVLCHELFHSLGAPDLYQYPDLSLTDDVEPIEVWDLMATTSNPPQAISAYMKYKYTEWIDAIPVIGNSGTYTLYPNSLSPNHAYRINSPYSNTEYFVVEYRSNEVGLIDSTLPGSGLIVYRVDMSSPGNIFGAPFELYAYRPNGDEFENVGEVEDAFFNSTVGRVAINDATNPSSWLHGGRQGGLDIYNIGVAGETISFSVGMSAPEPVRNLTGNYDGTNVNLSWLAPLTSDTYFSQSSSRWSGVSFPSEVEGIIAHRFTQEQLRDFNIAGQQLTKVGIFSEANEANGYIIKIWTGGSEFNAGELTYSQTYSGPLIEAGWTDIALDEPVDIPTEGELWIGFLLPAYSPIAIDMRGYKHGYGDLMSYDGIEWEAANANFNFMIRGLAQSATTSRTLNGFNVYKGSETSPINPTPFMALNYSDSSVAPNETIEYKVTAMHDGRESEPVSVSVNTVSDKNIVSLPPVTRLGGNYPNPFNPETTIKFSIAKGNFVKITIHNIKGQKVRSLMNDFRDAGEHNVIWNGKNDEGISVGSGIYFYRMSTGDFIETKKMILLK
jgi:M6 family metalloprotease-like protein